MKRFKKTIIFAVIVIAALVGVYTLDYKKSENLEKQKEIDSQIISFAEDQINYLEITKKDMKIVLQKNERGWFVLEPIQDKADNNQIEELIKSITSEKMMAIAKESPHLQNQDLTEYGLDNPLAIYNIKNNLGQSKKISIGTQKNFEGNSFIRIDSENKVYVAQSIWFNKAENGLIFYRDKRLYREPLADITQVKIISLQDHFELKKTNAIWSSIQFDHILDQNKVRESIRKISESLIQDYVFEGEPSQALIREKGLSQKKIAKIEFSTAETNWSVIINVNEKENAIYAMTERPTRLVKLDPTAWELIGNLTLDSLRDRVSVTRFSMDLVKKIYVKDSKSEMNFVKINDKWEPIESKDGQAEFKESELMRALKRVHDLEISEFIDKKNVAEFKGQHMIILKSDTGNLVYQINWGPEFKMKKNGKEKSYYYARTQASSSIFAIEKETIDSLKFDQVFLKKESQ